MAVGPRFNDPATQAAMAAQAASAEPAPETKPASTEPDPNVQAVIEPKPDETPAKEPTAEEPGAKATEESAKGQEPETKLDPNMENVQPQTPEEIDKALETAGFDNEALGKEFADNGGKFTEETVKALKEKFDPKAVDNAIEQMAEQWKEKTAEVDAQNDKAKAKVTEMNTYIFETLAGGDAKKGKENFATLSTWAKENLPAEELATINTLLKSGDKAVVRNGLEMAVSKWKAGKESKMMSGDSAAAAATTEVKFEPLSKDAYIKVMMTEKYNTDPAYAEEIDNRRRKTMETEGYVTPEFSHLRPPI